MADTLSDLRGKLAELRAMDLPALHARVSLWRARVNVEDLAEEISRTVDVDTEIVLLVTRAAWTERLLCETADAAAADPDGFGERVEADARAVLEALATGSAPGSAAQVAALQRARALGAAGVRVIPVRQLLDQTRCLIGSRV